MRVNEYKKEQILVKIKQDDQRSKSLMREKAELLESRRRARDDAIHQKEQMSKKFEYMQTKGSMDVSFEPP
jgi:hypothetical protein